MSTLNAQARNVGRLSIVADMPRLDAACVGYPTEWWFSDQPQRPDGIPPDQTHWREPKPDRTRRMLNRDRAIAICHTCPALQASRDYTEQHPEMTAYGIWAGKTGTERLGEQGRRGKRAA